ncbi:hypothetical protein [Paenibacillus sp. FSL W8-1287]|uniref:hypothetical protein n=1 Tax=Paenibacillus sp. FSL W8-1287 TaxID=2954653 RepID=UPI0030CBDC82
MNLNSIKVGKTYVLKNGLLRRLEKLEVREGRLDAGYVPIDRKGNEGDFRWSKAVTFAISALGEAKA